MTAYYVEPPPVGNDDNNDGSSSAPWATLQKAASGFFGAVPQLHSGDTVVVRAGNYVGFQMGYDDYNRQALADSHGQIIFKADPGVIIDRMAQYTEYGIHIYGWNNVVIDGFTILCNTAGGDQLLRGINMIDCNCAIVQNNRVENANWVGIHCGYCDDILIKGNTVIGSAQQHGIYVTNSSTRPVIVGNTCTDNGDCGIQLNGDHDFGPPGTITNAVVVNNVLLRNSQNGGYGGSTINCDGVQDSIIAFNLLDYCPCGGISIYHSDAMDNSVRNRILYNTVIMIPKEENPSGVSHRNVLQIRQNSTDNTVFGNLFYTPNTDRFAIYVASDSMSGFVSDFNLVNNQLSLNDSTTLSLAQWQAATPTGSGQDQHSSVVTQAQIDAARANHKSISPNTYRWMMPYRGRS